MDLGTCQCKRSPERPCRAPVTQEDLLCDFCRNMDCSAIAFNGEWKDEHVIVYVGDVEWQHSPNDWVQSRISELRGDGPS